MNSSLLSTPSSSSMSSDSFSSPASSSSSSSSPSSNLEKGRSVQIIGNIGGKDDDAGLIHRNDEPMVVHVHSQGVRVVLADHPGVSARWNGDFFLYGRLDLAGNVVFTRLTSADGDHYDIRRPDATSARVSMNDSGIVPPIVERECTRCPLCPTDEALVTPIPFGVTSTPSSSRNDLSSSVPSMHTLPAFDAASFPIDQQTQVLLGVRAPPPGLTHASPSWPRDQFPVVLWLVVSYTKGKDGERCTVKGVWPTVTSGYAVPRDKPETLNIEWTSSLDHVIMESVKRELTADVYEGLTDVHSLTFASIAHEHKFARLRGRRVVSGSSPQGGSPIMGLLDGPDIVIASTGSELMGLGETLDGYNRLIDKLLGEPEIKTEDVVERRRKKAKK